MLFKIFLTIVLIIGFVIGAVLLVSTYLDWYSYTKKRKEKGEFVQINSKEFKAILDSVNDVDILIEGRQEIKTSNYRCISYSTSINREGIKTFLKDHPYAFRFERKEAESYVRGILSADRYTEVEVVFSSYIDSIIATFIFHEKLNKNKKQIENKNRIEL